MSYRETTETRNAVKIVNILKLVKVVSLVETEIQVKVKVKLVRLVTVGTILKVVIQRPCCDTAQAKSLLNLWWLM